MRAAVVGYALEAGEPCDQVRHLRVPAQSTQNPCESLVGHAKQQRSNAPPAKLPQSRINQQSHTQRESKQGPPRLKSGGSFHKEKKEFEISSKSSQRQRGNCHPSHPVHGGWGGLELSYPPQRGGRVISPT